MLAFFYILYFSLLGQCIDHLRLPQLLYMISDQPTAWGPHAVSHAHSKDVTSARKIFLSFFFFSAEGPAAVPGADIGFQKPSAGVHNAHPVRSK